MGRVNILGVQVDMVNIPEAAEKIAGFLKEDSFHAVYTPNSEIILAAYKDEEFKKILNDASLLTADGIGVVYASKILKRPIRERAAGFDIAKLVLEKIKDTNHSVFLFGSKPGYAEEAKAEMERMYPGLTIAGCRNGYFKPEEEPEIVKQINESGADLLFVCLGAPAQENWISRNKDQLTNVRVAMGIGGSLDVFAGRVERAPDFYCNHGLEWFYRLKKEPWRWKRMLALPKFAATVVAHGRKFPQEEL